jgi:hypothetical protein
MRLDLLKEVSAVVASGAAGRLVAAGEGPPARAAMRCDLLTLESAMVLARAARLVARSSSGRGRGRRGWGRLRGLRAGGESERGEEVHACLFRPVCLYIGHR